MSIQHLRKYCVYAVAGLAIAAAPLAQAESANPELTVVIGVQGNDALHRIRSESSQALKLSALPQLPAARVVRVSETRQAGGTTAATVRCAE